jgi:hypothetical protein
MRRGGDLPSEVARFTLQLSLIAMPHLTIPDEYAAGLAQLITLSDEAVQELTSALAESQSSLDIKAADAGTSLISSKVSSIPTRDLRRVLASLLSLYSVRASSDVSIEEFLDDIVLAMKRSKRSDLSLESAEVDQKFRNRLRVLLALSALTTASKAIVIQHEHEHTLCSLRIFTDARPVYGDDVMSPPSAVAITHMLKLTYHEADKTEEIYIAFDKEDLLSLKSQITRAESKAASLHMIFERANLPVIE